MLRNTIHFPILNGSGDRFPEITTRLLVATTHYVDEVRGLEQRRRRFQAATTGVEHLEAYVEFWGNYIPEVYGMAKALLVARETDEAAAAAWDDRMSAVRESCRRTIEALHHDRMLAPEWSRDLAVDLMWTILSIRNWEQLTTECGWSTNQYVSRMQKLLKRTFVRGPRETYSVEVSSQDHKDDP